MPIYLVENNICERAIASDINEGPTENARQAVSEADLTEKLMSVTVEVSYLMKLVKSKRL